jgi:predicted nucleic acid-binding protein
MSRVYLDACSIIYLVEAAGPFHNSIVRRLLEFQTDPAARLVTSHLSRLECRVRPLARKDNKLVATYDAFFGASRLLLADLTAEVIDRATVLRAEYGFKTPDAIHLASAIVEKTDIFLTGDHDLARCKEISVEVLEADQP